MYRVRTSHTGIAGAPYLSTFYFDEAAGTAADASAAVEQFWTETVSRRISALTATGDAAVDHIAPDGNLTGSTPVSPWNVASAGVGGLAARATQGLLRLGTGQIVNGRRLEGKLFLPAVPQGSLAPSGQPTSAYQEAYETAAGLLVDAPSVSWVVWSRAGQVFHPVTSASLWAEFAVLRSRRD